MRVGDIDIDWLGWATFRIKSEGIVVYTDPYVLPPDAEKADIILISHAHYDHCDPNKVNQIKKEGTVVIAPPDCKAKLTGVDVKTVKPGDVVTVKGVNIKAVLACNIGKPYHPRANNWVGFVVTIKEKKIYHAGDTDFIPEMNNLATENIDVALLPIGGTYVMTDEEAVEAALTIKPKIVVPMHYGNLPQISLPGDPKKFKEKVESRSDTKVEILSYG